MNKQIQTLLKQARQEVRSEEEIRGVAYRNFEQEVSAKFAELIVRECALVATQQFTGYTYPVNVANYVTAGKAQSARMIKQHFGVE